ncbi:hypothetical protein AKJ58_01180 [candidate division MSBL1 archaeon SCGC-AAA385D11]|uniref:MoaB/Mog domain-containing protein n=1 Tax=candidate division MSBL1 archaeon SCGC-AAA385D11 TaxID=1698286 RepID=A0A133VNJ8_9EURY|nr:hypothetical protein AKJ58_01180 [candidate division MSBL1 archaeon SCGC-AAA385D11]
MRLEHALSIILSNVHGLGVEEVPFDSSFGRVLADDVVSKVDVPPFDRSAMDGYAVRASDTFGAEEDDPAELRVVGSADIGTPTEVKVGDGESVEIMTGAPVPEGADAVVMIEHTRLENGTLKVFNPVSPGENVSSRGEDVERGQVVLEGGHRIRPQDVGMLASTGTCLVKVTRRPKVGIYSTGSELREPGEELKEGEITLVNGYSLKAAVEEVGGKPFLLGIVPDEADSLKNAIGRASDFDVLLLSGGSSVGKLDMVPDMISDLGELLIHGIAIRPGGPTAFGIVGGTPVFALAGFPVASLVAFEMLVRPALRSIQGLPADRGRTTIKAILGRKISSSLGRVDVVRVEVKGEDEGPMAYPIRVTGSSVLSSMTRADGFIVVPEDVEGFSRESEVEVELYG